MRNISPGGFGGIFRAPDKQPPPKIADHAHGVDAATWAGVSSFQTVRSRCSFLRSAIFSASHVLTTALRLTASSSASASRLSTIQSGRVRLTLRVLVFAGRMTRGFVMSKYRRMSSPRSKASSMSEALTSSIVLVLLIGVLLVVA
nr:MAG TPA: hypothetical protein [Caudoviricetes sp.]